MPLGDLLRAQPWRWLYIVLGLLYLLDLIAVLIIVFFLGLLICGGSVSSHPGDTSCMTWFWVIVAGVFAFYLMLAIGSFVAFARRARLWVLLLLAVPQLGSCVAGPLLSMH